MTGTAMTVLGPVDPAELGHVQPHEHLFTDLTMIPSRWDLVLLEDETQMIEEARRYLAAGGNTIVDVTPIGIGRKPESLRRVAAETGLHIVMGTGWYRSPYYPIEIDRTPTRVLADMIVDEIEHGWQDTGIRPGIIGEIGCDKRWVQGDEERVIRASSRAQRRTGLCITTHTPPHAAGHFQELFVEEGVDPSRVVFGHCDNTLELEYLESILRWGAYVEFDLIGIHAINADARRRDVLIELIGRGYAEQLLLSLDLCARARLSTNGGEGYGYLIDVFLPMLREAGVDEELIELLTRTNPQRVLTI